jgi:hypothetical protein
MDVPNPELQLLQAMHFPEGAGKNAREYKYIFPISVSRYLVSENAQKRLVSIKSILLSAALPFVNLFSRTQII